MLETEVFNGFETIRPSVFSIAIAIDSNGEAQIAWAAAEPR